MSKSYFYLSSISLYFIYFLFISCTSGSASLKKYCKVEYSCKCTLLTECHHNVLINGVKYHLNGHKSESKEEIIKLIEDMYCSGAYSNILEKDWTYGCESSNPIDMWMCE